MTAVGPEESSSVHSSKSEFILRVYRQRARPRPWLFPARDRRTPLPATTLQKTLKLVVRQSGLEDASIHTLRHSYAAHLLEQGVSLRVIPELLGHQSPRPPARYTHLTSNTVDVVHATINALMAGL